MDALAASIALVLSAVATIPHASARDLVKNGGFEDGTLDPWQVDRFTGDGHAEIVSPGPDGAHALRLTVGQADVVVAQPEGTTVNPMRVHQDIVPPTVGELVVVSALGRADSPDGHAAMRVEVLGPNPGDVYASRETSWPPGEGTTPRELHLYVPPGATALRINLEMAGRGDAIFDGIRTDTAPAPIFQPGTNVLTNGGFERGEAGWVAFGRSKSSSVGVVPDAARAGKAGARVTSTGGKLLPNYGQEILSPSFSGQEIVVAGWLRAQGVTDRAFLGVFVWGLDPKGRPFQRFETFEEAGVSGDTDWTQVQKRISLAGLAVHGIVVRVCLRGAGTVDADDLEAGIVAGPPAASRSLGRSGAWAAIVAGVLLLALALRRLLRRRRAATRPS